MTPNVKTHWVQLAEEAPPAEVTTFTITGSYETNTLVDIGYGDHGAELDVVANIVATWRGVVVRGLFPETWPTGSRLVARAQASAAGEVRIVMDDGTTSTGVSIQITH
jgi:hypothetical protein